MASLGKKFEASFRENWKSCFPGTFLYRLPDQQSYYKGSSQNFSDFIAFNNGILWLLECKETKEGTLNFAKMRQMDLLASYAKCKDVAAVFVIWYSEKDKIVVVPAAETIKMRADGLKSVSLKDLATKKYIMIDVPAEKKRKFLTADYASLIGHKNELIGG